MSADEAVAAAVPSEPMTVKVTLTVTHSVTVRVSADSSKTVNELRDRALSEFHRDPGRYGNSRERRTDDAWRAQFQNRHDIVVGDEKVSIAGIETIPTKGWDA